MIKYAGPHKAMIKVIGVGGGGSNAVNSMIDAARGDQEYVEFICTNTDAQALQCSKAPIKIQLGQEITEGLGAGANPEVGRRAAEEDAERIREVLAGCNMLFIAAGMGGGTGTGAAPVVARIAKELGILTVAVVTRPFVIEGKHRLQRAEQGISELKESVDSMIIIPNQRLVSIAGDKMTLLECFNVANKVLIDAVYGIIDLIHEPGLVNVDFADVRTVMSQHGVPHALMGTGVARGENRAHLAAQEAISSPLLSDVNLDGAKSVLINFTGDHTMTLSEVLNASKQITQNMDEDRMDVVFGAVCLEGAQEDEIKVTVIATGFDELPVDADSFTVGNPRPPRPKPGKPGLPPGPRPGVGGAGGFKQPPGAHSARALNPISPRGSFGGAHPSQPKATPSAPTGMSAPPTPTPQREISSPLSPSPASAHTHLSSRSPFSSQGARASHEQRSPHASPPLRRDEPQEDPRYAHPLPTEREPSVASRDMWSSQPPHASRDEQSQWSSEPPAVVEARVEPAAREPHPSARHEPPLRDHYADREPPVRHRAERHHPPAPSGARPVSGPYPGQPRERTSRTEGRAEARLEDRAEGRAEGRQSGEFSASFSRARDELSQPQEPSRHSYSSSGYHRADSRPSGRHPERRLSPSDSALRASAKPSDSDELERQRYEPNELDTMFSDEHELIDPFSFSADRKR